MDKMVMTFLGLVGLADFNTPQVPGVPTDVSPAERSMTSDEIDSQVVGAVVDAHAARVRLGGFVYNVELHLPESRDDLLNIMRANEVSFEPFWPSPEWIGTEWCPTVRRVI